MKKLSVLISCILCFLLLCGCTGKVEFSAGKLPADSTEIALTLESGECSKLELLPALVSADLRGSENYAEIYEWALANPNVSVLYTVPLPSGSAVESDAKTLELSAVDSKDYGQIIELLAYMPQLETVSFEKALSAEELLLFYRAQPQLRFDCTVNAFGQSFSPDVKELSLIGAEAEDYEELLSLLPALSWLETVELGDEESSPLLSWETLSAMQKAAPDCNFKYSFSLYKLPFSTDSTEMDLNHIRIYDEGELVKQAMSIMPKLEYVDMDSCGVSNPAMAGIRDAYPEVKVVWRVWFGDLYSVRTDVEKILASSPSAGGYIKTGKDEGLYYCTDVKYLDLGHNDKMDNIDFVANMPKLEVAIFAMGIFTDISPLANCTELEFLEIQTSYVSDISALEGLSKLKHLNICYLSELDDISPIMDIDLERLWIGDISPIPTDQVEEYKLLHPDCDVNTTTRDPHGEGWRYVREESGKTYWHPRYVILVEQFGYDRADYSFAWKDPLYY